MSIDKYQIKVKKVLIAILPGIIVAGLIFGANVYYDLDIPQLVVSEFQKIFGNLEVTATTTLATVSGYVGIATTSPAYTLDVSGALRLVPYSQPTGANGVVYYDSTGNKFRCYQNGAWVDCVGEGGSVGGSGTTTYLAKWTATTTLGNSIILDNGSLVSVLGQLTTQSTTTFVTSTGFVGIATTTPYSTEKLSVYGNIWGSGNIVISGIATTTELRVTATTTLGSATSSPVIFTSYIQSSIIPYSDNTYNLGSPSFRWANIYGVTTTIGGIVFEKGTSDLTLTAATPTADRTITFPDLSGTVAVSSTAPITLSSSGVIGLTTPLAISYGGTATSTIGSAGSVVFSNGTTYAFTGVGNSGQPLLSGGAGAPTWGTLGTTYGGTGQNWSAIATGSLPYFTGIGTMGTLSIGATNTVLTSSGSAPQWSNSLSLAGTLTVSGTTTLTTTTASRLTISELTPGSVLFAGSGGQISQNNTKLYWDNTNLRFGIGTSTLTGIFHVATGTINALVVDSVGNVGIGTTAPGTLLTLRKSTAGNVLAIRNTGDTADTFTITDAGIINLGTWQGSIITTTYGGTGANLSAGAQGGVVYMGASSILGVSAAGSSGQALLSGGTGLPTWGTLSTSYGGTGLTAIGTANQVLGVNAGATGLEYKTISGASSEIDITHAANSVTIGIVDPLTLSKGGTGANLTAVSGGIVYSGASAFAISAAGTAGQALISGGTGAPTWFNPTAGSVIFAGSGGVLAQDNTNFFWDNTNKRLGIGTVNPADKLHVYSAANANKYVIRGEAAQTNLGAHYQNVGVYGIGRGVVDLPDLYYGYAAGVMGIGDKDASYHAIGVYAGLGSGPLTLPSVDSALYANGNNLGYAGIFMSGNVGIGTATPSTKLAVAGLTSSQPGRTVCADSSGNFYYYAGSCVASSEKYKNNISDLNLRLEDLLKLRPVTFEFAKDYGAYDGTTHMGFIAEEVEKVIPILVDYTEGSPTGVRYTELTALLVKGIQEQQQQIEELKIQLNSFGLIGSEPSEASSTATSTSFIERIKQVLASFGLAIENGIAKIKEIVTEKLSSNVVVTNQLCLGQTCIDEAKLKELLERNGMATNSEQSTNEQLNKEQSNNEQSSSEQTATSSEQETSSNEQQVVEQSNNEQLNNDQLTTSSEQTTESNETTQTESQISTQETTSSTPTN